MQLKSIKLIGFKSFADNTVFPMTGRFNAIVGPNGCGKSNVIDAMRWVIGESSAKQLRGQSMADVIFNGTTGRKPVGKAAVELLFDNSEGRIGGEYAKYAEISVRREVTRDGLSDYYLNGVSCRKKDITDIFLGTGLGPRSYAIIEQGMVSRLVEAKPDELRVYLEEAAGISKYKDRRRETETRMRHTQENLSRVNDLCLEIDKQLQHLERQAKTAEKYQVLRTEEREQELQLAALEWRGLQEQLAQTEMAVQAFINQQESLTAEQRELETQMEQTRLDERTAADAQSEAQKGFYGLGAEIARIEQRLKHLEEQVQQWELELDETSGLQQEMQVSVKQHDTQINSLQAEIESLKPQQVTADGEQIIAQTALVAAEKSMQDWQESWDQFQQHHAKALQQVEVSKTQIHHLQNQQNQLRARQQSITEKRAQLPLEQLESIIGPLALAVESLTAEREAAQTALADSREKINARRTQNQQLQQEVRKTQAELAPLGQRQASLQALQKAALGKNNSATQDWLGAQQLSNKSRLAEELRVDSGWEQAVETVLAGYFDAVCVESTEVPTAALSSLQGQVTLLEKTGKSVSAQSALPLPALADKVSSAWPAKHLLAGVFVANDTTEAMQYRDRLSDFESIITKDGVWMSPCWFRVRKLQATEDGVLVREQLLEQIKTEIAHAQQRLENFQNDLKNGEAELQQLEQALEQQLRVQQQLNDRWSEKQTEWRTTETRLSSVRQQQEAFARDLMLLVEQLETIEQQLVTAEDTRQTAAGLQAEQDTQRQAFLTQREECRELLNQARQDQHQAEKNVEHIRTQLNLHTQQIRLLQQTLERETRQLMQLSSKQQSLQTQLVENETPKEELAAQLQALLSQRMQAEGVLKQAEKHVQDVSDRLAEMNDAWQKLHRRQQHVQQELQQLQMTRQTWIVNQEHFKAQIEAKQGVLEEIIAQLPENATVDAWKESLAHTVQRIERLGPINLAAIDECKVLSERKEYLDKQQADLHEALEILGDAIRKIDQETRAKFRETYESVNASFAELFPKIFGGGAASLELQEAEGDTNAGIVVRAQPPGKKNATIHMLSGGEKALTAIALVFAFFQLNPSPFCILDEVDAPLDDANVGRYCQLVKEMSNQIQFVVISHNKVTIEAADSLLGVTMQEAGVSRVVTVNMEAAVAMAG